MSKKVKNETNLSSSGLRKSILSPIEVLAQSIANIAPSATPALVIPLVFGVGSGGNGTWLAYLVATIAIVLVGANLNQFTKRSASPGSLYSFIVKGLGSTTGVIAGWTLVLAYLLTASAVLTGFINYVNVLLTDSGIVIDKANLALAFIAIGIIGAGLAWFVAVKDIKLSAKIMLVFEGASLLLILTLAAIVLGKHGAHIDYDQFKLKGVTPAIGIGLVLAFFSFTGFESAAALGDEAKRPLKSIPKAVTISAVFVGIFFVILSYTEVLGFKGVSSGTLDGSAAPLADLANLNGVNILGTLISIGAVVSFWACFLACINAGARVLFTMSKHGIFHSSVGNAHEENKTPHRAITISAVLAVVVPLILIIINKITSIEDAAGILLDTYGWVGTIATYGFISIYGLISLSSLLYLRKEKELKVKNIVLSISAVLILLSTFVVSIYSNSSAKIYNTFIFVFLGWILAGGLWFFIRRVQSPNVGNDISDRVESVHQYYREFRANGDGEGI